MKRMGSMVIMVHNSRANMGYEFDLAAYTNFFMWSNGPGKEVNFQPRFEVSYES